MMKVEQCVRVYLVHMYLKDNSREVKLNLSEDFIYQLENNPEFRIKLGEVLGKPFLHELKDMTITPLDILK